MYRIDRDTGKTTYIPPDLIDAQIAIDKANGNIINVPQQVPVQKQVYGVSPHIRQIVHGNAFQIQQVPQMQQAYGVPVLNLAPQAQYIYDHNGNLVLIRQ